KVHTANLEPGMFVAQLDRPWLETPFTQHGFCVQNEEEIRRLRQFSQYAYVDPARSTVPHERVLAARSAVEVYARRRGDRARRERRERGRHWLRQVLGRIAPGVFASWSNGRNGHGPVPVAEEAPRAAIAYDLA